MGPLTNRIKIVRYFFGLTFETNNFNFKVKVIIGFESSHQDGLVAKWGVNDPPE